MAKNVMKPKDPGSAITHFIGMLMATFATLPLLFKASRSPDPVHFISLGIFALSMILLYTASTVYHTFDLSDKINRRLKKFDHMMIFILIAGTYTPVCLIVLNGPVGFGLLALIWGMALLGICLKAFWVYCPKWVSSIIYIAMGWTCVLAISPLTGALSKDAFNWLLAGGIIYTVGGVIYALKLPIFNNRHKYFGSHEIFHLFCLGGSACHFILMYKFIASMPL
ncbi:MAG: hemolysin III family protein [Anaerocolumna sp.]